MHSEVTGDRPREHLRRAPYPCFENEVKFTQASWHGAMFGASRTYAYAIHRMGHRKSTCLRSNHAALSIEAHRPDGTVVGLVEIDDWDPHWRRPLMLQTPIQLPVGTRLKSSWTIANTKANERNPFVPLEQYSVAMRTGAVAWLLHVAAVDASDDSALVPWGQRQLLKRQRDSRVDSPTRPRVDKNKS